MNQEYNLSNRVHINRDDKGIARELLHNGERFVSTANTAQLAATQYLGKYGDLLGIKPAETNNLALFPEKGAVEAGGEFRFQTEKQAFDMTTVMYQQTYLGLPIWHAGVAVH